MCEGGLPAYSIMWCVPDGTVIKELFCYSWPSSYRSSCWWHHEWMSFTPPRNGIFNPLIQIHCSKSIWGQFASLRLSTDMSVLRYSEWVSGWWLSVGAKVRVKEAAGFPQKFSMFMCIMMLLRYIIFPGFWNAIILKMSLVNNSLGLKTATFSLCPHLVFPLCAHLFVPEYLLLKIQVRLHIEPTLIVSS